MAGLQFGIDYGLCDSGRIIILSVKYEMSRQIENKKIIKENKNENLDDSLLVEQMLTKRVEPEKASETVESRKGYNMFELASVLQKDLRRGKEYEALFWAVKLASQNPTMLWNRLAVIASEDVGPANPTLAVLVDRLRQSYFNAVERKSDSYRLFITHAVIAISRSPKSRIVDDLLNVVYGQIQNENLMLPIPDYAYDKHTSQGKKMGRSWDHFFSEGTKLENETKDFANPYADRARKILMKYGGLKNDWKETAKIMKKNKQADVDRCGKAKPGQTPVNLSSF